jgi:UDP-N-acetylmuramyl pentapeptide phosphotransferase/UDP-N-acetylglucosamine-1-phosphate transferase
MNATPLAMAFTVAATGGATIALSQLAARSGLADDPAAAPERKLQPHAVPAIGGGALLVGLCAASAAVGAMVPDIALWPALALAFAVGLVDDRKRGGLAPSRMLLGQSIVAAALVTSGWRLLPGDSLLLVGMSFLAPIVAMNAINTLDTADGAASSLGILGLAAGAPLAAAPLLGFLPVNLWLRRDRAPLVYLGNSGSHLLGILVLSDPIARAALVLPLHDLARLAVVRARAGKPPWKGDRQHLAHRLQDLGVAPTMVVVVLLAIAAPSVIGARASAAAGGAVLPLLVGSAATAVVFGIAVFATAKRA